MDITFHTSRGTYTLPIEETKDLIGCAIDGLASRLSELMDQFGWEEIVSKDDAYDAEVLKRLGSDYAEIYEPIIGAYEAGL